MVEDFKVKLIEKINIAPDVWQMRFQLPDPEVLEFTAGQYLLLKVGDLRRAYSIASPDHIKDYFELIVRFLPDGVGSNYFRNLKIGESSEFQGPMGFFTLRSQDKDKFFLAVGTGITPIRSQIYSLLKKIAQAKSTPRLTLFWGLKNRECCYLFEEFKKIREKYPKFSFQICLDQQENFEGLDKNYFYQGRIQQAFAEHIKTLPEPLNLNSFEYYLCGFREVVESLKAVLEQLGVNKENIFFDKY